MTDQHPLNDALHDSFMRKCNEVWESTEFNCDYLLFEAFDKGADHQLKQVVEWLKSTKYYISPVRKIQRLVLADQLEEAMRPTTNEQEP